MIIVTSEYIFLNPKIIEINDTTKNTILKRNKKYGGNYCTKIKVEYNMKIFDKTKNKTKKLQLNIQ